MIMTDKEAINDLTIKVCLPSHQRRKNKVKLPNTIPKKYILNSVNNNAERKAITSPHKAKLCNSFNLFKRRLSIIKKQKAKYGHVE